jgi:GntR family transcriptional repressor for pyruvate dehydrogenase complex
MIVEPELAARAAQRASAEDLIELRRAITAMETCRTNQERLDADLAFHDRIFRASGNRICHLLFKVIHRSVLTSMSRLSTRVAIEGPLNSHKRIYAAPAARRRRGPAPYAGPHSGDQILADRERASGD